MIAGFCELDSGEIRFGAQRIDRLPAHIRDIGMVFQNYAVFPNLTVAGNVAYGLKARKVPAAEIAGRVDEALALVQLTGYGGRWPHQLSGGQLQRVAIARALVIRPQVLLFDEPLSNLDARLRVSMRAEIRELQKSLGITAIYVTHDQEEAMSVSDRIALMNAGRLEQVGIPVDIYRHPVSRFAAEFMGTTNLVPANVVGRSGGGMVSLRPEALRFAAEAPAELAGPVGIGGAGRAAGADHAPRRTPGRRHDPQGRPARRAGVPGAGGQCGQAGLRSGAPHGAAVRLAIPCRSPTASACRSPSRPWRFVFLGLFLLYPLFNVFSASLLDPEGERLTFANYAKMLGRPFYRTAIANTLGIGLAATVITTALAVPLRLCAGAAADSRQGRDPGAGLAAAGPAVVRQRLRDRPAARPFRHRHAVAAVAGRRLRLDLRRGRHRAGLHADALSLRAAADDRGLQGGRRVDGGGARKVSAPRRAAPSGR